MCELANVRMWELGCFILTFPHLHILTSKILKLQFLIICAGPEFLADLI